MAKNLIIHKVKVLKGEITTSNAAVLLVNKELRKRAAANHTATHLLFAALRDVLGCDVAQQGSFVAPNRLRADVFLNNPLTKEQIKAVENKVTGIVLNNLPINTSFMPYKEAISKGVCFLMGEEYPEVVRVVSIGEEAFMVSKELCGGCHAKRTGEIGMFKIISESGIRSGVRRLEIVTGIEALNSFQALEDEMNLIYNNLKANKNNIITIINNLVDENKDLKIRINNLESLALMLDVDKNKSLVSGINFIDIALEADKLSKIKNISANIVNKYKPALFFANSETSNNFAFLLAISENLGDKIDLLKVMQSLKSSINAKGGGNKYCIQGNISVSNKEQLHHIIQQLLQ